MIGFTGATIADMAILNPEAIALVNDHPEVFEVILRPFSHDIALLRSPAGFALNVKAGRAAIVQGVPARHALFSAGRIHADQRAGEITWNVQGSGEHSSTRPGIRDELRLRILPTAPISCAGRFRSRLRCIPIEGALGEAYLQSLHLWDAGAWNHAVAAVPHDVAFSWRDGESFLFVPDGIERERAWLQDESRDVQRVSLAAVEPGLDFRGTRQYEVAPTYRAYRWYPVHSFSDWVKEFRMFGYMERLAAIEKRLDGFDHHARALWLQAINSDVFSAVEKDSPVIALRTAPQGDPASREILWTIQRSSAGVKVRSSSRCSTRTSLPRTRDTSRRNRPLHTFGSCARDSST